MMACMSNFNVQWTLGVFFVLGYKRSKKRQARFHKIETSPYSERESLCAEYSD